MNSNKFFARRPLHAVAGVSMLLLAGQAYSQSASDIQQLKQQLEDQRALSRQLEQRIDDIATAQAKPATPAPSSILAGYEGGFYLKDASGNNALYINGLLQPRFNRFTTNNTSRFGGTDGSQNNFDIFLGRLYFSGNVADPSVKYFFTLQGTTAGNGSNITLLDAFLSKTFNPYLTVTTGKYYSAYTYEYYTDIGQYLIPDLSAAEWAFSLGRQTGVRFSGKTGDLTYNLSASNSIPGSDVGNTQNSGKRLAAIINFYYDILAPYGYKETNTDPAGVKTPQLSLWASAMYNPVAYTSVFQNDIAGDRTHGATTSLNYRYGLFTFQGSGYYKQNQARNGQDSFSSTGWQEQAGYYLIPGKLEIAQRIDGIRWGRGQIASTGGSANQWYAGPANFSFRRLTEYTLGLNYYLYGNNLKAQFAYSYIEGKGFDDQKFDANRFLVQTQLAF